VGGGERGEEKIIRNTKRNEIAKRQCSEIKTKYLSVNCKRIIRVIIREAFGA
jgi:hypothetical protein